MNHEMKGKQPYIPIYIGDWEQDVNTISLLAEGALLKLIFKLHKSPTKGEINISLNSLAILLKISVESAEQILDELSSNQILEIANFKQIDKQIPIKICSRRMLKETNISKVRSLTGTLGGLAKSKQSSTKPKANSYQSAEYEYENENKLVENKEENKDKIFEKKTDEFSDQKTPPEISEAQNHFFISENLIVGLPHEHFFKTSAIFWSLKQKNIRELKNLSQTEMQKINEAFNQRTGNKFTNLQHFRNSYVADAQKTLLKIRSENQPQQASHVKPAKLNA